MTDQEIKRLEDQYFRQFLLMCFIAVCSLFGIFFLVVCITDWPEKPGEFGDLFGVCTCLFSGLAFCGLLYTVRIQKLELRITRDELQKTALANEATANSNEKNLKVQRLSSIIAGRQAILDILSGPNTNAARDIWDRDSYNSPGSMLTEYVLHIKNALNELDKLNI